MMRATSSTAPGAAVDVGAPQLGAEEMPTAEYVERQIAVAIIVAVEETALLMPVQGIIGGIEVEDDALRRSYVRLQKQGHEQLCDSPAVVADLVIARRCEGRPFLRCMLQSR
jgi:hypothetical protein